MPRLENWVTAMQTALADHQARPFAYDGDDCFNMCADVAKAINGTDPFADLRGYTTLTGAMRILKRQGFEDIGDLIASRLKECAPLCAARGDLAMIDDDIAVGIVTGAMVEGKGPEGPVAVPLSTVKRAFRVG